MDNPYAKFKKAPNTANPYAKFAKQSAPVTPEPATQPEFESNWYDAPRAALEGMTFGFADEVGAGVAAGAYKLLNDTDQSFSDIYRDMKGDIESDKKAYADENPLTALGLNVGGSIASGGALFKGLGALGNTATNAVNASRGGSAVTQAATNIARRSPRLAKTLGAGGKLATVGAIDGGLTGAGISENMDNVVDDATRGAIIGGVASPILGGAGDLINRAVSPAIKRRIAQSLDAPDGTFTDLNYLADEGSAIQNLYQKIVAPAIGGGSIRDRSRLVLKGAEEGVEQAEDGVTQIMRNADAVNLRADDAGELVTTARGRLNKAKEQVQAAKNQRAMEQDATFRLQVRDEAIPPNTPPDLVAAIRNADGSEANRLLREANRDYAFQGVKQARFNVNLDTLTDDILKKYGANLDADGKGVVGKILREQFAGVRMPQSPNGLMNRQTGEVTGDVLMNARNALRVRANAMSDGGKGSLESFVLKDAAAEIDDFMVRQLPDDVAAAFNADKAAYAASETFRGATETASKANNGFATTEQLLAERLKSQRRNVGQGQDTIAERAQQTMQEKQRVLERALAAQEEAQAGVASASEGVKTIRREARDVRRGLPQAREALDAQKGALKDIKAKTPNLNPAAHEKALATILLGSVLTPILGIKGLPAGAGLAKGLSLKTTQRIIAGQSIGQEQARILFKNLSDAGVPDAAIRAASREIVVTTTELDNGDSENE